ncbi:MAG: hypothetical protein ACYCOR_20720 [Acidobacteriaceae bacterium]
MTLTELAQIRRSGQRPGGLLWVGIGGRHWLEYDLYFPKLPVDLRPFVDLDVWVTAEPYPLRDVELAFDCANTLIVDGRDGSRCSKWNGKEGGLCT